jgi:hypothetical protein
LRILTTYFLLFGILINSSINLIKYVNFKINQDYIANNLCVKKAEPDNCCKGKCQLEKELIETEKESTPKQLKEKFEENFLTDHSKIIDFKNIGIKVAHFTPYSVLNSLGKFNSKFIPPEILPLIF